jgi:uncharacterized protein involved in response to NO
MVDSSSSPLAVQDAEQYLRRLFSFGFRPLFLCMVLSALILIAWWIGFVAGYLPAPRSGSDLLSWHAHEMLFGFVGAAVGGFLLTAVANWTGRAPVQGLPLLALVTCWLAARVFAAVDMGLPTGLHIVVDISYWCLLSALMAREVIAARNYRNLKIAVILALFALLNLGYHFYPQHAIRATSLLVCILISVIGGRIIPAFTGNWLRHRHGPQQELPPAFNRFDLIVIIAMVVVAIGWTFYPAAAATGIAALVTGLLQLVRLVRWKGHLTWVEPLVLMLHVGYGWLGIGLLLMGVSILTGIYPTSAGIHGLTIGAMAGLIIAVSSRAAFGHTDRPLVSGGLLSAAFVLINLAAIARIVAAFETGLLFVSGLLWLASFLLYAIRFVPILLGPKAGREG